MATEGACVNDAAYDPSVSEGTERVVWLTVILPSPFKVDIGEIFSWNIK